MARLKLPRVLKYIFQAQFDADWRTALHASLASHQPIGNGLSILNLIIRMSTE